MSAPLPDAPIRLLSRILAGTLILHFLGFAFPASAQHPTRWLHLVDDQDGRPIAYATFRYGDQQGTSDGEGQFTLSFSDTLVLFISHLEYGLHHFESERVRQALDQGRLSVPRSTGHFLQPVTVLAIRASGRIQGSTDFESREWLAHDAGEVLTQQTGLNAIRKAGKYGLDPVFRGFKYEQLNIVVDGAQSCIAACPNRMDPPTSQISLNQMERVEIIKGPHGLRYGAGLGGTLLFASNQPAFSDQPSARLRASTSYESNGSVFRSEALAGFTRNRISGDVNASWSKGEDYKDGDGNQVTAGFNRASMGANLKARLNSRQTLALNATRNLSRDVRFAALGMDLRRDASWTMNARHEWQPTHSSRTRWTTMAYFTRVDHLMDNLLKDLPHRMMNMSTDADTRTWGARSEWTISIGSRRILYLGADHRTESAQGLRTREFLMGPMMGTIVTDPVWQDGIIRNTALFAELQQDWSAWQFTLAGRLAWNQSEATSPSALFSELYDPGSRNQFLPSFSAGIRRQWNDRFSTSLWLARASRSGSLLERFVHFLPVGSDPWEMLGNPDLKPEVNHQMDLQLRWESGRTIFQLHTFGAVLQDMIMGIRNPAISPFVTSSPGVRQYDNLPLALLAGGEGHWTQDWGLGLQSDLQMAYTYGQDLEKGHPLAEIPPLDLRLHLKGQFFRQRLEPRITLRQVWTQSRISSEFGEMKTDGFFLVDVQAGYQIIPSLRLAAGVHNLLDRAYAEHLNRAVSNTLPRARILEPGRNFFLTASFSL